MFIEALRGLQASVSNIDIVPVLNDFRYFVLKRGYGAMTVTGLGFT